MKASIKAEVNGTEVKLHGVLGITNAPYTAVVELTRPGNVIENRVVSSSGDTTWQLTLQGCEPGEYRALIRPREEKAFEATLCKFTVAN
ncbi:MAG: hypothetical protein ABS956_07065 [Pseudomonas sp.]|uniref:hypothetical protein n=1 Tax=Pseudomonas sp. TaxID=306 RepID=UPI003314CC8F